MQSDRDDLLQAGEYAEVVDKMIVDYRQKIEIKDETVQSAKDQLNNPNEINATSYLGGVSALKTKYHPFFLQIALSKKAEEVSKVTVDENQASSLHKLFSRKARIFKEKSAYKTLLKGKKFKKAGFEIDHANKNSSSNPIMQQSKKNMQNLRKTLNRLDDIEIILFEHLLSLPYKLQHATSSYYPILNSGTLDSTTEIQRRDSSFQPSFSTKGNIAKLGNGGFIFFRVFVDPINPSQTRYGDARIITDMNLLLQKGWISLHDQLNPFPSKSPNTKHFYEKKRLLRTSKSTLFHSQVKDQSLADGLLYEYRESTINSYTKGKDDTLKSFGKTISTRRIKKSFLEEIFYGHDILPGIALSVIQELRQFKDCGFRKYFFKNFNEALLRDKKSNQQQEVTVLLAHLLKDLFRIEGKYPVSISLEHDIKSKQGFFKSYHHTSGEEKFPFEVINPEGDGIYHFDMTTNYEVFEIVEAKKRKRELESELSARRRNHAKSASQNNRNKISQLEIEMKTTDATINSDKTTRDKLVQTFINKYDVTQEQIQYISTVKLQLTHESFGELIEEEYLSLDEVIVVDTKKLRLLSEEFYMNQIIEGNPDTFSQLSDQSIEELESGLMGDEFVDAAESCEIDKVIYLIRNKRVPINSQGRLGYTALHHAVEQNQINLVEFLLREKNINIALEVEESKQDQIGGLPIHIAAYKGHIEILKMLIKADKDMETIDEYEYCGYTPLHEAILNYQFEAVKLLVENGACITSPTGEDKVLTGIPEGLTPRQLAKHEGYDEIAKFLEAREFSLHGKVLKNVRNDEQGYTSEDDKYEYNSSSESDSSDEEDDFIEESPRKYRRL